MRTMKFLSIFAFLFTMLNVSAANIAEYNVTEGSLALKGYDPVSYYPEGGGKPEQGLESITLVHDDVTYRFTSTSNLDTFKANPEKYRPTYGGWCAFAMANGQKVDPDLTLYTIQDGRVMLFVPGTKDRWIRNESRFTRNANRRWKRISGEDTVFFN